MKCRNCGAEVTGRGRQCPKCGILLKPSGKIYQRPAEVVEYSTLGGVITGLAVAVCVLTILSFVVSSINSKNYSEREMARFAELVESGSAAQYRNLIEARMILDSLPSDLVNSRKYEPLMQKYYEKRDEASQGWIKAAEAQYDIADDIPAALKYFNRVDSIYPGSGELRSALDMISVKSGLKGVSVLFSRISVSGTTATLGYKYYGSYDTSLRLRLVWEDGYATRISLPLTTGNTELQSYSFEINGAPDDNSMVEIYEGSTLLLNTLICKAE